MPFSTLVSLYYPYHKANEMKTIEAKNDELFYAKYEQKLISFYNDKYVFSMKVMFYEN